MRLLFLNPGGSLGGAERCLLDLVASIRAHVPANGVTLGLVAGGDGPLVAEARALGMTVMRLPMSDRLSAVGDSALIAHGVQSVASFTRRLGRAALDAPSYALRLDRVVREFDPSVVHSNGIKMHLLAATIRRRRAPLLWHVRDFIGERPLVGFVARFLSARADAAIAISNAVAEDARRAMPGLPVAVVHDAIDTETFQPNGRTADLDSLAGCARAAAGTIRIGFVATYARWKGHDVFLQAASLLKRMVVAPPMRFYIVGGPIYDTVASQYTNEELRALTRDLALEDSVKFVPFQERVDDVYRALDIVVHASSRPEPFGRTIAEAMATGKPVVASRESGAAELFVDGVDAIGIPARDPQALAEAVGALVRHPAKRDALGEAARRTAVARFSRERLAEQILAVYRSAKRGDLQARPELAHECPR